MKALESRELGETRRRRDGRRDAHLSRKLTLLRKRSSSRSDVHVEYMARRINWEGVSRPLALLAPGTERLRKEVVDKQFGSHKESDKAMTSSLVEL
uniref:Uncharacterized protein n=1 Tax=Plectus sambesii TaxID=2011161 RepID=A0A914VZQ6_9BILA